MQWISVGIVAFAVRTVSLDLCIYLLLLDVPYHICQMAELCCWDILGKKWITAAHCFARAQRIISRLPPNPIPIVITMLPPIHSFIGVLAWPKISKQAIRWKLNDSENSWNPTSKWSKNTRKANGLEYSQWKHSYGPFGGFGGILGSSAIVRHTNASLPPQIQPYANIQRNTNIFWMMNFRQCQSVSHLIYNSLLRGALI